jgi:hypothetical protein
MIKKYLVALIAVLIIFTPAHAFAVEQGTLLTMEPAEAHITKSLGRNQRTIIHMKNRVMKRTSKMMGIRMTALREKVHGITGITPEG